MPTFRPALVPEPVRPLVLAPIFLVRNFVNSFFYFVMALDVLVGIIVATVPTNIPVLTTIVKALVVCAVVASFSLSIFGINKKRVHLCQLLKRLKNLCAGDLFAAAALAKDLTEGSAKWTSNASSEVVDNVMNFDIEAAAGDASETVASASDFVYDASERAVRTTADATTKTAKAAGWAAGRAFGALRTGAGKAAGETVRLLSDPVESFDSVAKGTVEAGGKLAGAAVDVVDGTGKLAGAGVNAVADSVELLTDASVDAAKATLDVAGAAADFTMAGITRAMELNPIYIFKKIVTLVLKATLYIVIGMPVVLCAFGIGLWMLGILPSVLEVVVFAVLTVVVGPLSWILVRKRALKQLDVAGLEIIRINAAKAY